MDARPQVDVLTGPDLPPQMSQSGDRAMAVRKRWQLLILSFVGTAIIGLLYVWLRAPLYQSYAILHLSYAEQKLEQLPSVAAEQLTIHQQRLTSQRMLSLLSERLTQELGLLVAVEDLHGMLDVEARTDSKLLKVSATGTEAEVLLPVLQYWIALYIEQQQREQSMSTSSELAELQEKLDTLEEKVADKRASLAAYTAEHEIISLERDENRVLSQIKGLSNSLDVATEERAAAQGQLRAIQVGIAEGKVMVRPQDQQSLDNMEDRALTLEEQLFHLAQQYTPEYMQLDPKIVGIKNNLASLRNKIEARRTESQQAHLNEAEQNIQASTAKETNIRDQLNALQSQAQSFNHRLSEYNSMSLDLEQIEMQAQLVREQLLESEVRKPFQASIDILESPLAPEFPIGPNYLQDTGIALLLALLVSLATVGIYALISRQHQPGFVLSPYAIINPERKVVREQISNSAPERLAYQELRELSDRECAELLATAPLHTKLALSLVLSGVAVNELAQLRGIDFDLENNRVRLAGTYARALPLASQTVTDLQRVIQDTDSDRSIWQTPTGEPLALGDLELILNHTAQDVGIDQPDGINFRDVRHTYLLFLARQGAHLGKLEQLAGYLSGPEIELCRGLAGDARSDQTDIQSYHSILVDA